jgi:hypothetical protein
MDAVGAHGRSQVRPVIEHEGHPFGGADPLDQVRSRDEFGVVEELLPKLHDVDSTGNAPAHEHLEVGPVRGAEVEPAPVKAPVDRGWSGCFSWDSSRDHPGLGSWARASAFACCLNWRTLASASGESISATERCDPVSP